MSSMSPFPKKKYVYITCHENLWQLAVLLLLLNNTPQLRYMTEVRVQQAWSKLASSINTVRYVKRKKKKQKQKKEKTVLLLFPPPQGFPKLFINNWFPVLYKREDGGKQERRNETTFMDLIRSNKKGLRHGRFCSFQFQDLIRLLKF